MSKTVSILALMLTGMLLTAPFALAQSAGVNLSVQPHDASLPVEVTAESLKISQTDNTAVFSGTAVVAQGSLKLAADSVLVRYKPDGSGILSVKATGNVMFTNGAEIAEGNSGTYDVASSLIKMTGNVVLLQGQNAISGDSLTLNLITNAGEISGNIKSIFVPKGSQ